MKSDMMTGNLAASIGGSGLLTSMVGCPTFISPQAVVTACAFAVAVGICFGLYATNKVSKLDPLDALHYE